MDIGDWWATVHGDTKVGHNLVAKPPPSLITAWTEKILPGSFYFCSDEVLQNMVGFLGAA